MRPKDAVAVSISLILTTPVLAQPSRQAKAKETPKTRSSQPVFTPADTLKWTDLDPDGAPGVKVADLWGDHTKGSFGAYFRLPAGFAVPLHTHTHDMRVVFLSGTYVQAPEGKPEVRLGPGSYMMQPGGNYRHTTSCDKASECLFFVQSNGPFDLKLVEPVKAGAGKNVERSEHGNGGGSGSRSTTRRVPASGSSATSNTPRQVDAL